MKTLAQATAHGKIILTGEHAAVHGFPAVVASLSMGVRVSVETQSSASLQHTNPFLQNVLTIANREFDTQLNQNQLKITSDVPIGSGLGSSAATAAAIFQAISKYTHENISKEKLFTLVQRSEQFAHGNPSGIDATAVVYEGTLRFQKKDGQFTFSSIKTNALHGKTFFLIQSGIPKETTKEMIEKVKMIVEQDSSKHKVLENIGQLSTDFYRDLEQEHFNPEFFSENEKLLEELSVVGSIAKKMIKKIESVKGYAKVSGGGGLASGSGILLTYHPEEEVFENFIKENTWEYFKVKLGS